MKSFGERWSEAGRFTKLTAILCVIMMVVVLIAYNNGSVAAEKRYTYAELVQAEQDVEEAKAEELEAKEAHEKAVGELIEAEEALDRVCTRSSYFYYSCDSSCRALHTAEDEANEAVFDASNRVDDATNAVSVCMDAVGEAERAYDSALTVYIFALLAVLLIAAAPLVWVVYGLFREYQKIGYLASYALGLGAFVLLICFPATFVAEIILGILAILVHEMVRDDMDIPIAFRNTGIVLSVLAALAAPVLFGHGSIVALLNMGWAAPLYAAALICVLFVLIPLEFTKYIPIAKHLFLSVITCGIWTLVWIYHVTKNLNEVAGAETRKPACELALCMFLPLYYAYWLYKTAESVELYAAEQGKECKLESLALIFAFVNPLFATVLTQSKINWIAGRDSE